MLASGHRVAPRTSGAPLFAAQALGTVDTHCRRAIPVERLAPSIHGPCRHVRICTSPTAIRPRSLRLQPPSLHLFTALASCTLSIAHSDLHVHRSTGPCTELILTSAFSRHWTCIPSCSADQTGSFDDEDYSTHRYGDGLPHDIDADSKEEMNVAEQIMRTACKWRICPHDVVVSP
nr:hypothetical protein CFP56_77885 [Quercus suber]